MEQSGHLFESQDPAQEYVSSEELVRALTSIETQQMGETADRLKIGEAIRQLGLDLTPEQILAAVNEERERQSVMRNRATARSKTIKIVAIIAIVSVLIASLISVLDLKTATRPREAPPRTGLGSEFDSLMQSLRSNSFDEGRVAFVKVMAKNRTFNVDQVRAVMQEMSFDRGRVDAAVILYPRMTDPQNAYRLLDTMSFDAGRQELIARLGLDKP